LSSLPQPASKSTPSANQRTDCPTLMPTVLIALARDASAVVLLSQQQGLPMQSPEQKAPPQHTELP
nr:hypothetical protein [Polyangiaceae bacterium]